MDKVLFETSYMNPSGFKFIIASVCMLLFFYLCFMGLIKVDRRIRIKGKRIGVLRVIEKVVLFFIIIYIVAVVEEYVSTVVRYKTGHYIEIEGVVENYSFIPGRKGTIYGRWSRVSLSR